MSKLRNLASNSEKRSESKQVLDGDDRRRSFETKEASAAETRLDATNPCSTLPDDPVEVQRLRTRIRST